MWVNSHQIWVNGHQMWANGHYLMWAVEWDQCEWWGWMRLWSGSHSGRIGKDGNRAMEATTEAAKKQQWTCYRNVEGYWREVCNDDTSLGMASNIGDPWICGSMVWVWVWFGLVWFGLVWFSLLTWLMNLSWGFGYNGNGDGWWIRDDDNSCRSHVYAHQWAMFGRFLFALPTVYRWENN